MCVSGPERPGSTHFHVLLTSASGGVTMITSHRQGAEEMDIWTNMCWSPGPTSTGS
jgi:hypothetical protein